MSERVIPFNGMVMGLCEDPKCRCLHIELLRDDEVFASAVLTLEQLPRLIEALQRHAYTLATEEEERCQPN